MAEAAPLTFLCITTYEKGQEFMRECKRQGLPHFSAHRGNPSPC